MTATRNFLSAISPTRIANTLAKSSQASKSANNAAGHDQWQLRQRATSFSIVSRQHMRASTYLEMDTVRRNRDEQIIAIPDLPDSLLIS